jgi:hypothetical protein
VAQEPVLILQLARGSAVDRQLGEEAPAGVASGEVVIDHGPADSQGHLEAGGPGEVVLSLPSPEGLAREADEVRRVIAGAGSGVEPLVVVIEAAEELREDELGAVVDAARHSSRPVIVRILRDG